MVEAPDDTTGMAGGDNSPAPVVSKPFLLVGSVSFAPRFFPERIQVTKERELDRSSDFCGGEDVSDKGSKNRDIHINGRLLGTEKNALDRVADTSEPLTMSSTTWSGEVRVSTVEYDGPKGYHPPSGSLLWEYTIDLVSTGRDEDEGNHGNGIISSGSDARVTDEDLEDGQQGL